MSTDPGTGRSPRIRAALAVMLVPGLAIAQAVEEAGSTEATEDPDDAARTRIISPGARPSDATTVGGPGVELITGGSSTDGAAKVGRLPVID